MTNAGVPRSFHPPCNACGAQDWVVVDYSGGHSQPYIPLSLFNAIPIKARVCLTCGQLQMCFDQKGMDQLNEWRGRK